MDQLMENLFSLLSSPMASEAERRAIEESEEAVRVVEKRLTREEFENLWSAVIDIGDADCLRACLKSSNKDGNEGKEIGRAHV